MHKNAYNLKESGFTLIELLIVIVIIAALAVSIFIALNPVKRLQDARNARRVTDIESIRTAINQYLVDKGVLPAGLTAGMQETQIGTSNGTGVGANNVSCVNTTGTCNATAQSCVDLTTPLANYLKSMPKDPAIGSASATGYSVSVDANNSVTVTACDTESNSPVPVGVSGNWNLVFDDEFNGNSLDTTKWSAMDGDHMNNVSTYASNVAVSGGDLILTLASAASGAYICSCNNSSNFALPVGGYAEASVYFPGNGTAIYNWPAWWTSGPNWPAAGEHDIAEGLGTLTVNYHSPSGSHNLGTIPGIWSNGFHTYGLYRQANQANVYWDGQLVKTYPTDDNGQGQSLIFNVGNSTGSDCNCGGTSVYGTGSQVKVDYVRAWIPTGATPTPPLSNLLQNGSFDNTTNWLFPWSLGVKSGLAAATISPDSTTKVDGTNSANVQISQANATDWYVQLTQGNLAFVAGNTYNVSFWAKASIARPMSVILQQGYAPYTEYFHQSVNLTTGWQQYTYTFTPTVSDADTSLHFNLASNTGNVWIDAVLIK